MATVGWILRRLFDKALILQFSTSPPGLFYSCVAPTWSPWASEYATSELDPFLGLYMLSQAVL